MKNKKLYQYCLNLCSFILRKEDFNLFAANSRKKKETGLSSFFELNNGVQFGIVQDDKNKNTFLVIRASDEKIDWWHNFLFLIWGGVHLGFKKGAKSIFNLIESGKIDLYENVIITGHSKGAAEAIVLRWLMRKMDKKIKVITFGGPKAFSWFTSFRYDRFFKDNTIRFVNHGDIVPLVPMEWVGFRDVGHEYYFEFPKGLQIDPPRSEKKLGAAMYYLDSLNRFFIPNVDEKLKDPVGIASVAHSLETYRDKLDKIEAEK